MLFKMIVRYKRQRSVTDWIDEYYRNMSSAVEHALFKGNIFKQFIDLSHCKNLYTFQTNYDSECKLKSKKYEGYWCSLKSVERILKNFGQYISVASMIDCDELLKPGAKYCGTATLESLDIQGSYHGQGKDLTMEIKMVFQRLVVLSLWCNGHGFFDFLSWINNFTTYENFDDILIIFWLLASPINLGNRDIVMNITQIRYHQRDIIL